jgi:hypothetical protein
MAAAAPTTGDVPAADPRRRCLLALAGVAICVLALLLAPRSVRSLVLVIQETPEVRAQGVLVMLLFAAPFTLLALIVAVEALRRSVQALATAQFPPPGMPVVRTTPVVRGRAATVLGTLGLMLGGTLLVAALLLPWMAFRIGRVLQHGCPRATPASEVPDRRPARATPWHSAGDPAMGAA